MTLTKQARFDAARRLIAAVCGDEAGDGLIVTDVGIGYASTRYGSTDDVWVLGDWNDKSSYDEVTNERVVTDSTPSRLLAALERIDVECEWHDEWDECRECWRLIRTSADSYSFELDAIWVDCEGYICGECARQDIELSLINGDFIWRGIDGYLQEPEVSRVVSFCTSGDLVEAGFKLWTGVPEGTLEPRLESGWHPGQDARPDKVAASIVEALDDDTGVEIVFYLDEASQFYVGFSAYYRTIDTTDEGN